MSIVVREIVLEALFILPTFLAVVVLALRRRAIRQRNKLPFKELRRRPPGEFLRTKLEGLNEAITEWLLYLVALPAVTGVLVSITSAGGAVTLFFFAVSLLWTSICAWRVARLSAERANYDLGFEGERFVAAELDRLLVKGFEVYHDLPFDGFNIDHVVAGTPGVFAIETKARRKPLNEAGDKEYRVIFDGTQLCWPNGSTDTSSIDQAVNNARTVSEWLSGAVGEPISAIPILTLPGWMVDRKGPPKLVHVLNPKEIPTLCDSNRVVLDENLLKRVLYQLDQKCRMGIE